MYIHRYNCIAITILIGKIVIDFPTNVTAGEEYSGSCTSDGDDGNLGLEIPDDHCTTVHRTQTDQRINFTLTCKEVSNTLTITCDTSIDIDELSFIGKTNGTLYDYHIVR